MRVFAGQEPGGVWVGWITPDYHQYDPHFDMSKVRNVTVTVGDDKGNIHDRYVALQDKEELVFTRNEPDVRNALLLSCPPQYQAQ